MKKKGLIFSLIAVILAVLCFACVPFLLQPALRFGQIYSSPGSAVEPPAKTEEYLFIVEEGTYPGFSDVPVSEEQGRPYREVFAALQEQQYKKLPSFISPASDGIAIRAAIGCSPAYLFYWDGFALWVHSTQDGWLGYVPSEPEVLETTLNEILEETLNTISNS